MSGEAGVRLAEGIHLGVPEAEYHADPCVTPSASSGILRTIVTRTPMHAHAMHPRLGGSPSPASTEAQAAGSILHSLILGTPAPYRVLNVTDYKTNAARALQNETIAAGLIPVKRAAMEKHEDVAASIRVRLQAMPETWAAMQDAVAQRMTEATLIWRERGVLCRCRYDTLPAAKFGASFDLKFTGKSADPEAFGRTVVMDHAIQAEFYPRAVKALRGDSPLFVFVAAETTPPFGVSLHALAPDMADLARRKVDAALHLWGNALKSGVWPGYPTQIHHHVAPSWAAYAWDAREMQMEDAA